VPDRWLVDGMNVIGSRPDHWWEDRDGAVREMVRALDAYAVATGDEVTVVFDGRPVHALPAGKGPVRVVFASRRGRDAADHEIVDILSEDEEPSTLRVVTSDNALAARAEARDATVLGAGSFRRRLDEVDSS
jgi:predicted RNA-binding protein with PIN domain